MFERRQPFGWTKVKFQCAFVSNERRIPHVIACGVDFPVTFGLCSNVLRNTLAKGGIFWMKGSCESVNPLWDWAYPTYDIPRLPPQTYVETLPTTVRWQISDPELPWGMEVHTDQLGLKIRPWLHHVTRELIDVEKVVPHPGEPFKYVCSVRHVGGPAVAGGSGLRELTSEEVIHNYDRQWSVQGA